jgi:hypothetical protein
VADVQSAPPAAAAALQSTFSRSSRSSSKSSSSSSSSSRSSRVRLRSLLAQAACSPYCAPGACSMDQSGMMTCYTCINNLQALTNGDCGGSGLQNCGLTTSAAAAAGESLLPCSQGLMQQNNCSCWLARKAAEIAAASVRSDQHANHSHVCVLSQLPAGCKPGRYLVNSMGKLTCSLCPKGSWCSGGSAAAGATTRPCSGDGSLTTASSGAAQQTDCGKAR